VGANMFSSFKGTSRMEYPILLVGLNC